MKQKDLLQAIGNLWRARRLLDLASKVDIVEESRADLLGATIVFLHATLEEYLRSTALRQWPRLQKDKLQAVIKQYSRLATRNVKLSLDKIAENPNKTYESLLIDELQDFLYQSISFNSIDEIRSFLKTIGISFESIVNEIGQDNLNNVEALIYRRHLVAHQANCNDLDADQIIVWGKSLQKLLAALSRLTELNNDEFLEELKAVKFRDSRL